MPPIRFHDGRHAAATYLKAVGGDLLDMKKKLGHASITVTADTYPAALDHIDRELAGRTASLVPRKHRIIRSTTPAKPDGKAANSRTASTRTGNGRPDLATAPFSENSMRAAASHSKQRNTGKAQGKQRKDVAAPTDSPTPRPPDGGRLSAGDWPPPERRANRYPRDLR